MDHRVKNAKVPKNIVKEELSNLYSYQVFFPHKTRNEFSVFSQIVYTHKDVNKTKQK